MERTDSVSIDKYVKKLIQNRNLTLDELERILLLGEFTADNLTENMTLLEPPEMPRDILLWLEISKGLWWYVVTMSFLSLPLYGYALRALCSQQRMKQQLCFVTIVIADLVMLFIMGTSLVVTRFARGIVAKVLCKLMIFASNTASFYTNWCWVMLWGRRYLAIFYPLRNFKSKRRLKSALLCLFTTACLAESWTLVYTTEYDFGGISFCELDAKVADYAIFKWIVLTEALLSYALPLALTMIADLSVLCRSYAAGLFTPVTSDDLGSNHTSRFNRDAAKIMPRNYRQNQLKRKQRSIVRCILAATLDVGLNFPDYTLQILDNFVPLRELLPNYKLHYGLEAVAYILYTCQYPLIILYVRLVLRDFGGGSLHGTSGSHFENNTFNSDTPQGTNSLNQIQRSIAKVDSERALIRRLKMNRVGKAISVPPCELGTGRRSHITPHRHSQSSFGERQSMLEYDSSVQSTAL